MGEGVGSAVRKGEAEGLGVRVLVLLAAASVIIMKVAVVYGVTFFEIVAHFIVSNTYIVVGVAYTWWCFVAIVEVGPKYRVTITQGVRRKTPLRVGQKVYLLARPPYIVLIPIPDNLDDALAEILGDIAYSREERKRAEEQLLKETS